MDKIKVLVADDHAIVRTGLVSLLSRAADIEVVGEASNGAAAVTKSARLMPDVVVMDLVMPKKDGVVATAELHERFPGMKILVLTSFGTSAEMAKAIQAGAAGALLKESPSDELIRAICTVMDGKTAIHEEVSSHLADIKPQPEFTQRQLEILQALATGLTDKAIAEQFEISVAGVRKHLNAIMAKLGAFSRTETVAVALRKHLLDL